MSTKNWIRTMVAVGLVAWPGVETYRYFVATQQLKAALQQEDRAALRLAQARVTQAKEHKPAPVTPVANPTSSQPKDPSTL